MKKKIICILLMMLFITITVLPVTGKNDTYGPTKIDQKLVKKLPTMKYSITEVKTENRDEGEDVLVVGTTEDEYKPQITSDINGNLYIAIENQETDKVIVVYVSTDDGDNWAWNYKLSVEGNDLTNPSIAIGMGNQEWLFVAFQEGSTRIWVFRVDLNNPNNYDFTLIRDNSLGVANPKITTDSVEYLNWYPYLVFNEGTLTDQDAWQLSFTRSIDYGDTWESIQMLHLYSQWPFYNGEAGYPDIEFGSDLLLVVFDDLESDDNRDVYALISNDYGASWNSPEPMAIWPEDEYDPAVAVVHGLLTDKTVIVLFTREQTPSDNDIGMTYTQDSGTSWTYTYLSSTGYNEINPDITVSYDDIGVHAIYWCDWKGGYNIEYMSANYHYLNLWAILYSINEEHAASEYFKPSITVNPTITEGEACFTWTDFRNSGNAFDIYFDSWRTKNSAVCCSGSLEWIDVQPGGIVTGQFEVCNCGEPLSLLTWNIDDYPDWGTFTFSQDYGVDLKAGECDTVQVTVIAPDQPNQEFSGTIRIVNDDNPDDYCEIPVTITTPRNKVVNIQILNSLQNFLQSHPNLFPLLQKLIQQQFGFGL